MINLYANIEYTGNCKEAIDFFTKTFGGNVSAQNVRTYHEMPMAEAFGISGDCLDLIWQGQLVFSIGQRRINFDVADSLMTAMQKPSGGNRFKPTLLITQKNKDAMMQLQSNLAGHDYGINLVCQHDECDSIFYCLDFNGFCRDVVAYYEDAFGVKAKISHYEDAPYPTKIRSAVFDFGGFLLWLSDDSNSAQTGENTYDPGALLFYKVFFNPVLSAKFEQDLDLALAFDKLSVGAKLNKAVENGEGSLIDKYGICWHFKS